MKTLNSYTSDKISAAMEKHGAYFAFSKTQFEEKQVEGVKYVSDGSGMVCPKENYNQLIEEMNEIYAEGVKQDIAENGLTAIIKRELANYECYYTGDIEDAVEALEDYGVTYEQVLIVFQGGSL
ncbi:hypothetical protein L5F64_00470 [Aliarcobacter butzleri]|uniref:DUF7659 family protein n=1 Tax=Aliarcobacter butzleri TaxID=28197 RepID=UPI001EDADCD9|nr:hypothetical protein [Aliarcobacter butzleri]MCG3685918.1 hypothetical protein [Aliarcobacter butzleri]MCG3710250.1 hypothetical protein [Aliarcobacter butzleri]MCG3714034.1 hypothetical protein [Aliarcobacter butzleri]